MCYCGFKTIDKTGAHFDLRELACKARKEGGLTSEDQHIVWHLCQVACSSVGGFAFFLLDVCCQPFEELISELTVGRVSGKIFPQIVDWLVDYPDGVKSFIPELMTV